MSRLWNWINKRNISKEVKKKFFLVINCLKYGFYGLVVWLFVSKFTLNTIDWAICFVGYPAFFVGFLGGYLYLCKQEEAALERK